MDENLPLKRGAPRGNKNAFKHGFYSRSYRKAERPTANSGPGHLQGDINLFKVLISRFTAYELSTQGKPASFAENLATLHIISVAVARLNSLCNTNQKLFIPDDREMFELFKRIGVSEEKVRAGLAEEEQRTRGAQPGNVNAIKHGFYASLFKASEIRKLDELKDGEVTEEIALMRTLIKRTFASMPDPSELSRSDMLKAMSLITYAEVCVQKLEITQKRAFSHGSLWDQAIAEVLKEQRKKWLLA